MPERVPERAFFDEVAEIYDRVRPGWQLPCRATPELVCDDRHRSARVGHNDLRSLDVERSFGDDCNRAVCDRLAREVVPVHLASAHAEEERAGAHPLRIDGEVVELAVCLPDDELRRHERKYIA